jgi:YD repeat-containing protein
MTRGCPCSIGQFAARCLLLFAMALLSLTAASQVDINKADFRLLRSEDGGRYSGDLQLTIPVMTVPGVDGLDFPISLNFDYNARPDRMGGWVGLNWTMQLGSVTRSVNNYPDDQTSGDFSGTNSQFNIYGSPHYSDPNGLEQDGSLLATGQADYFDTYYLILDGSGHKLVPIVPITDASQNYFVDFKTEIWQPWNIYYSSTGWGGYNESSQHSFDGVWNYLSAPTDNFVKKWKVTDEKGCEYLFDHRNCIEISTNTIGAYDPEVFLLYLEKAKYTYPTSWDLTVVKSANYVDANGNHEFDEGDDGGWIRISYNDYANKTHDQTKSRFNVINLTSVRDVCSSVLFGVHPPGNLHQGSFGNSNSTYPGDLLYDYSCPESIESPTHIAVFEVTDRTDLVDNTGLIRGKKLTSITLYRKIGESRQEWVCAANRVKKIVFTYNYKQPGNQYLMLGAMQEYGRADEDCLPPYLFDEPLKENDHWRITYPEGGYVEYTLEDDWFSWYWTVLNDRMGGSQFQFAAPFRSYYFPVAVNASQATCGEYNIDYSRRVHSVQTADGMGAASTRYYNYGEGVLSSPDISSWGEVINNSYSAWHDGSVGYRWVETVNPEEGGKQRRYYTTGISPYYTLYGTGSTPSLPEPSRECYPDLGVTYPNSSANAKMVSNAGLRGMIWREELYATGSSNPVKRVDYFYPSLMIGENQDYLKNEPSEAPLQGYYSSDNTHRFISDDLFFSDCRTVDALPTFVRNMNSRRFIRTIHKSAWLPLTEKITTLDGVTSTIEYPIAEYDKDNGRPGVTRESRSVKSGEETRITRSTYAHDKYPGMNGNNMLDQEYMRVVYQNAESPKGALEATKVVWSHKMSSGTWQPDSRFVWMKSTATDEYQGEDDPNYKCLSTAVQYDVQGNLEEEKDGMDVSTSHLWGYAGTREVATVRNASRGAAMVAVFDDLETSKWTGAYGVWTVVEGAYTQSNPEERQTWNSPRLYDGPSLDDCILEGDVFVESNQPPVTRPRVGLSKFVDQNNFTRFDYSEEDGQLHILARKNGSDVVVGIDATESMRQWNHLKGEIKGSVARLLLNGNIVLTLDNPNVDISEGRLGLNTYDGDVRFDNVRFYPYEAQMSSWVFDPISLTPTASIDENGSATGFQHDGLDRLTTVCDGNGATLKEHEYFYSRSSSPAGTFDPYQPNYLRERLYMSPSICTTNKSYFDGLGQLRQAQTSIGDKDLITAQTYDSMRRTSEIYKTYEQDVDHSFDPSFLTHAQDYYTSQGVSVGSYPYSLTEYYGDPLGRKHHIHAPGTLFHEEAIDDLHGHYPKFSYGRNGTNEIYSLPSTLFRTSSLDENSKPGNETFEYKDKLGNLVAKVVDQGGLYLKTEYESDLLGNVTKIVQPLGYESIFSYDTRQLLSSKTTPDAGTVRYLYDRNGNLRLQMDAANTFSYRKYDCLNRLIETGIHASGADFTQTNANMQSFPEGGNTLQSVLVYDSPVIDGQRHLKGRLSRATCYREGISLSTTTYSYEERGRVEWLLHEGLGDVKKLHYWYDLQGNVVKKEFCDLGNTCNTLYTYYEYDPAGRLFAVYTSPIDDEARKTLAAQFTYTASNQVHQLTLGELPAQTVDYTYNERDWLRTINDVGDLGEDKFGEQIHYNTSPATVATVDQYNGNIAAVEYYNSGLGEANVGRSAYSLSYDGANRLTSAQFNEWVPLGEYLDREKYSLPTINYDPNGNITRLVRNGANGSAKDDLAYTYGAGNRLDHVTHGVAPKYYSYDDNGNVTRDDFREVTAATYDYRNLRISLTKSGGGSISYSYDGSGNRIRKTVGSLDERYIIGADGQTEAVYNADGLLFWNILANGKVIGKLVP